MLTVRQDGTLWAVWSDSVPLVRFKTSAEAWRWIDRHERRPLWARSSTAESLGAPYYEIPE